jgi:hypothetical protein
LTDIFAHHDSSITVRASTIKTTLTPNLSDMCGEAEGAYAGSGSFISAKGHRNVEFLHLNQASHQAIGIKR